MNEFEKQQVTLLATYYPFCHSAVECAYLKCGKSFDATCKSLEEAYAHNSIDHGIQKVNDDRPIEVTK